MEPAVAAVQIEKLDEKAENQILASNQTCGKLVKLQQGSSGKGIHISIHGLGSNPADMAPLTNKAANEGLSTATFAYNDMHCDHAGNSGALTAELKSLLAEFPGKTVQIETHSLGGRLALSALDNLQKDGSLPGQDIKLTMVAPPLAGFPLLNIMAPMPSFLAKLIPGGVATKDMASLSSAQSQLNQVALPGNVSTKILYGSEDNLIDYTTFGAQQMAQNLKADVYYIAGAGHYDMIKNAAEKKTEDLSRQPLTYMSSVQANQYGEWNLSGGR